MEIDQQEQQDNHQGQAVPPGGPSQQTPQEKAKPQWVPPPRQSGPVPPYAAPQGTPPPYGGPVYAGGNSNSKVFCILSYVGILWIIGLLADRDNPDTRFHVNQGILLTILAAVIGIADGIWSGIFGAIFAYRVFGYTIGLAAPGVILISLFNAAYGIVMIAMMIIGIVHAVQGKRRPLPVIGNLFTILK